MTENHSAPRSRSRRRADVQRLYAARDIAQQPMTEENQPAPPERHANRAPSAFPDAIPPFVG